MFPMVRGCRTILLQAESDRVNTTRIYSIFTSAWVRCWLCDNVAANPRSLPCSFVEMNNSGVGKVDLSDYIRG